MNTRIKMLQLALLLVMTLCILSACNSETETFRDSELSELSNLQRHEQLVALAVLKAFDNTGQSVKSAPAENTPVSYRTTSGYDNPPILRYEFDFVEINNAMRYTAKRVDFPLLNELCSDGEIEIFLTSFNTFRYVGDLAIGEQFLTNDISDCLIVFKGDYGLYSCMMNSGSTQNGISETVYSSHKRFGPNAVVKDFTPPLYAFHVKTENHQVSLACQLTMDKDGTVLNHPLKWTKLQATGMVNKENMFSVNDLIAFSETSQPCTITETGSDYFVVKSKSYLKKVFLDEYTRYIAGGQPDIPAHFSEGDVITVTFNQLFSKYNPKVTLANSITKQ